MQRPNTYILAGAIASFSSVTGFADGQTTAPGAAADSSVLEEVVVTANRRSENLQDVPVSVAAITGPALVSSGINNLLDLGAVVTGLSVTQNDGFANTHLRGVGSSLLGPGLENPIALYVDGVYYASSSSALLDFIDVEDVQVLKGPQGTLFGRNATGGLIQVTTKTPTQDFHSDIDLTYGNYNTSKVEMYVSGGLATDLAADFAAQVKHQGDGYGRNFATGQDVYQDDFDGTARSKWVFSPTDMTSITAIFDFSRTRNSDNVLTINPGTFATPASATYRYGNPWDTNTNVQPLIDNKNGGVSIHLEQDLGFARLSDIVAYRQSATDLDFDLDFTPLPEEGAFLFEKEHQFSEELQLQSKGDSRIKWTAGLYYFSADGAYVPPSTVTLGTAEGIALEGDERTQSFAGYSQATTEIFAKTNLTLGLRYTYEDRKLVASQDLVIDGIPPIGLPGANTSKAFDQPTYRIALDHRVSDATLAYASFNTGFKSGGFNTQVPTDPPFNPETLKAYEIGLKNDLFDRRLRANIAAFYYDYTNIQEQHLELTSSGVINGPPAHIYGMDLDLQARITAAFRVGAGFEYLHDRFIRAFPELPVGTAAGNVPLVTGSVQGDELPMTPTADFSLTADYTYPIFGGEADANATYEHNSGYYSEADNIIHQPSFNRLNLSLLWTSQESRYTTRLWCNNVTNVAVLDAGSSQVNGSQDVQYAPPRTYGVTVGVHF